MNVITPEMLSAYLEDALSDVENAVVEKELRSSETLRQQLRQMMQQQDGGDHSVGAIWRRQRLSCPSRDELGTFLLGVMDEKHADYVHFHLHNIGCAFCQANWLDLKNQQKEPPSQAQQRRRKYIESSVGFFKPAEKKKRN